MNDRPHDTTLAQAFGELRSLLAAPLTPPRWQQVLSLLDTPALAQRPDVWADYVQDAMWRSADISPDINPASPCASEPCESCEGRATPSAPQPPAPARWVPRLPGETLLLGERFEEPPPLWLLDEAPRAAPIRALHVKLAERLDYNRLVSPDISWLPDMLRRSPHLRELESLRLSGAMSRVLDLWELVRDMPQQEMLRELHLHIPWPGYVFDGVENNDGEHALTTLLSHRWGALELLTLRMGTDVASSGYNPLDEVLCRWSRGGQIDRVEVRALHANMNPKRIAALTRALRALPDERIAGLRALMLPVTPTSRDDATRLLERLPQLETLVLTGASMPHPISAPSLRSLRSERSDAWFLRSDLPALTHLEALRITSGELVALAASPLMQRLTTLDLRGSFADLGALRALCDAQPDQLLKLRLNSDAKQGPTPGLFEAALAQSLWTPDRLEIEAAQPSRMPLPTCVIGAPV